MPRGSTTSESPTQSGEMLPAAATQHGVLDGPGAHEGLPVVLLAVTGDPRGRDGDEVGAARDEVPGELGESHVVAVHESDPDAGELDH